MSNLRYDLSRDTMPRLHDAQSGLDFVYTAGETGLSAKLLYVSAAKYEKDWHSVMHTHGFAELFYIVGGKGDFCLEGSRFPLHPDDLVIINPQVEHTEESSPEHPLEYIVLGIEGLSFNGSQASGSPDYCLIRFSQGQGELRSILGMLVREIQRIEPDREAMCQSLLNVVLLYILRQRKLSLSAIPIKHTSRECAFVRRYIEAHFKEPLTLDELAEKAHLNKFYMSHEFKEAYDLSPINYLLACRLRESKRLLADTDHSLSQIAEFVGFSSASYFSQSFKKAVLISPQEYRRRAKGQMKGE